MARRKKEPGPSPLPAVDERNGRPLFVGTFCFSQPGVTERSGTFEVFVNAASPDEAVRLFRKHLRELRVDSDLFDDPTTIYLNGIVCLSAHLNRPVVVNFVSRIPPTEGDIECLLPEGETNDVTAFGLAEPPDEAPDDSLEDTLTPVEPFVDFGGTAFRRAVAASAAKASRGVERMPADPPRRPPFRRR